MLDDDELCQDGQMLWDTHLDRVRNNGGSGSYGKYLNHIWNCKRCQNGLGLTPQLVKIEKAGFKGVL
jgi:hypothetical protein